MARNQRSIRNTSQGEEALASPDAGTPQSTQPRMVEVDHFLSELQVTTGALFNNNPGDSGEPDASKPIMSGSITVNENRRVSMSIWRKVAPSGLIYCDVSIGDEGRSRYYGRMFTTGASERPAAPHYNGYVKLLPVERSDQYTVEEWDAAPTMSLTGWRRRSADGSARIHVVLSLPEVADNELLF